MKEMLPSPVSELAGLRVVFVFGNLEVGGAERQGLHLARFLKEECGCEVRIWGLHEAPGRLCALCDEAGIAWRGVPVRWPDGTLQRLGEVAKLARLLRRERPDVILSYTFRPNILCALAWRFTGARICVWNQRDEGLLLGRELWHRLSVSMASLFLTNSAAAGDFLSRTYGMPLSSVRVIPNGIDAPVPSADRSQWRRRLGVDDDCFVACMAGNIHRLKDHETLIRAWKGFLDRRGEALCGGDPGGAPLLVLAGRVDAGGEDLKELCRSLGVADRVLFPGEVSDVAGLFQAVDLCLHSSRSEGLPNGVLEGMAAGLPVVATDIAGIRQAVGPKGVPFLAPAGDFEAMAALVHAFASDASLRAAVGSDLQQRVAQEFDLRAMCAKTASVLAAELGRRR